jgi:hypothetical protein
MDEEVMKAQVFWQKMHDATPLYILNAGTPLVHIRAELSLMTLSKDYAKAGHLLQQFPMPCCEVFSKQPGSNPIR